MSYFFDKGKKAERRFGELVGIPESDYATKEEDMYEHWDLKYKNKKIDVKGLKKLHRNDINPNEDWNWIELTNVWGDTGWLYGKADQFAFETYNYWILVSKDKLQKHIEKYVDKTILYTDERKPYRIFNRKGRKDVITPIKTMDLLVLADEVIIKKKFYQYGFTVL